MSVARYFPLVRSCWWLLVLRLVLAADAFAPRAAPSGAAYDRGSPPTRIGPPRFRGTKTKPASGERPEAQLRPMERKAG
jgi:hypothetical protein